MKPSKILRQIKKLSKAELDVLITNLLKEGFIKTIYGPGEGDSPKSKDNEKSLVLLSINEGCKLNTVKAIKSFLGLGLFESKTLTDVFPSVLLKTTDSEKIKEFSLLLTEAGAKVEIK